MVNGIVVGGDIYAGSATVNGVDLGTVNWADPLSHGGTQLQAFGQSIPIDGPGTYHGTFTFTASMCGTNGQGSDPHACVIDLPNLTGSGTVDVTVGANQLFQTEVYTFVTPEPRTWMLMLLGIAALAGVWRRGWDSNPR
jgi:hypothetical protein